MAEKMIHLASHSSFSYSFNVPICASPLVKPSMMGLFYHSWLDIPEALSFPSSTHMRMVYLDCKQREYAVITGIARSEQMGSVGALLRYRPKWV